MQIRASNERKMQGRFLMPMVDCWFVLGSLDGVFL